MASSPCPRGGLREGASGRGGGCAQQLGGLGVGWRPELAWFIEQSQRLQFTEVVAENVEAHLGCLEALAARGLPIVIHGVSLGLGDAEPPCPRRVDRLTRLATTLDSPLVSEHIAFVRAGGLEAGHLLPVPRTREMLDRLIGHVRQVQRMLPVPLALENVASLFEWPEQELSEERFLCELLSETDALLLLDVSNLHAHAVNHARDPVAFLAALPLDRIAYVHVAGGVERDGLYHDTHAHAVGRGPLELLSQLARLRGGLPVLLERDAGFASPEELGAELDVIASTQNGPGHE